MASTTKKAVKSQVKEAVKKKIEDTPVFVIKSTLDPEHLKEIEVQGRDLENAKLRMAVEEQALQNMVLSAQLLQNKIEKQKQLVSSTANIYENVKNKFDAYKKGIWPLYGLKENEGMGYDPLTGEIKRA